MGAADLAILGLALAASIYAAWTQMGRAWLYLRPEGLMFEAEEPADQIELPEVFNASAEELRGLGFVFIGTTLERAWHRPRVLRYEWVRPADFLFGSLWMTPDGEARFAFTTESEAGAFWVTANHRRPVRAEVGRYQSSYLENASVTRLVKAHSRIVEGVRAQGPATLEGRVRQAQAWLDGPGRAEIRQMHLPGLLWTVGALGMVAAALWGRR